MKKSSVFAIAALGAVGLGAVVLLSSGSASAEPEPDPGLDGPSPDDFPPEVVETIKNAYRLTIANPDEYTDEQLVFLVGNLRGIGLEYEAHQIQLILDSRTRSPVDAELPAVAPVPEATPITLSDEEAVALAGDGDLLPADARLAVAGMGISTRSDVPCVGCR